LGAEGREGKETWGWMWHDFVCWRFYEVKCCFWELWREALERCRGWNLCLISLMMTSLCYTVNLLYSFIINIITYSSHSNGIPPTFTSSNLLKDIARVR
jgi:hypothetical protein